MADSPAVRCQRKPRAPAGGRAAYALAVMALAGITVAMLTVGRVSAAELLHRPRSHLTGKPRALTRRAVCSFRRRLWFSRA
jgi:hypothetical protein